MKIKGTQLFTRALRQEGVDTLFAYPGGFVTGIFDELYRQKEIRVILPRHEQALVHAADGYARATGRTGVALVTSGPGATNTITGIATAYYDSVPLVCFTGQVPTHLLGNDAFQEVDIVGMTRSITKRSSMVTCRADLGRVMKEAFVIAASGRPGPVVVDLPVDVMEAFGEGHYPQSVRLRGMLQAPEPPEEAVEQVAAYLSRARRPLLLAGGGVHIAGAQTLLQEFAEKTQLPVVTTIPGKGVLPADHPLYVGNVGMHGCFAANQAVSSCDLLLCIGSRLNDRVTCNAKAFAPDARIISIDIDPAAISRHIQAELTIPADAGAVLRQLVQRAGALQTHAWRMELRAWQQRHPLLPPPCKGLSPQAVIQTVQQAFPDALLVTDVGQNQMWTAQFARLPSGSRLITSGGLGTMGFGFPAALGAKLGRPEQPVVCITGDGGFQMNLQELATAAAQGLPVIIVLLNNGYLGMVRQWQQILFDRRYSCTDLQAGGNKTAGNYLPDFVQLAQSYGALGLRVTRETDLGPALSAAQRETSRPALIECLIDREANVLPMIPSGASLGDMILTVE